MKYLDEYRRADLVQGLVERIHALVTRPWAIMEVCGGQTHSIVKHGLDRMLPKEIELLHGPGCPVCVTPLETIDRAHAIAARAEVIFCSFGDMLRVPGSNGDLLSLKSQGADVRIVYSPLDAVRLAEKNPERQVVFFAIGFETTAPANAMAIWHARKQGIKNFSALISHVTVPPAIAAIMTSPGNRVQGFLGPGHVCTIMGFNEYEPLAKAFSVPIVITGFEPVDLLEGVLMTIRQLEDGRAEVENQYGRVVTREGNDASLKLLTEMFEPADANWRGIGKIPLSGYRLRDAYAEFDAATRFDVAGIATLEPQDCISGDILRGLKKPCDCTAFGGRCTPENPLGATMVSSEGACAAYFAYGRHREPALTTGA